MKISNVGNKNQAAAAESSDKPADPATDKTTSPRDANSKNNEQAISDAADRFLLARNGTIGQLLNPTYRRRAPEAAENRHAPSDTPPTGPAAETPSGESGRGVDTASSGGNAPGLPGTESSTTSPAIDLASDLGPLVDRDNLGGGTQTDGRNPNEDYSGGGDPGMGGNPYSGMDRSAVGKVPGSTSPMGDYFAEKVATTTDSYNRVPTHGPGLPNQSGLTWQETLDYEAPDPADADLSPNDWLNKKMDEGAAEPADENAGTTDGGTGSTDGGTAPSGGNDGSSSGSGGSGDATGSGDSGSTDGNGEAGVGAGSEGKGTGGQPEEDRGEDDYSGAPDHAREFTDSFFEQKHAGERGGAIDPGDDVSGATVEMAPTDSDLYTANYGEGHSTPTEDEIEAAEQRARDKALNPEEEF